MKVKGPKLQTIIDSAELLQGNDEDIRKEIALTERKFPQLKLMFCCVACPEETQPTTFAWWMLNHGIHSSTPSWSGLLLVDLSSHQVTFQAGYDLEIFINRQKLESILSECGEWFTEGKWSGGAANFFKELHTMLKQTHRDALQTLKQAL